MNRLAAIFAAFLVAECASSQAPAPSVSQPVAVADAPASDCPQRTETLYVPSLPEPGFVRRPPPGAKVAEPKRLAATRPDYPAASQRCGEQGRVTITYCVSPDGKVENVLIVNSSGFARLDNAMLAWAARDRHIPATVDGQPRRYCGLVVTESFTPASGGEPNHAL